jgi:hypothetical protein
MVQDYVFAMFVEDSYLTEGKGKSCDYYGRGRSGTSVVLQAKGHPQQDDGRITMSTPFGHNKKRDLVRLVSPVPPTS